MGAFSNMDYELQNSEAAVSDAFTEDDAMDHALARVHGEPGKAEVINTLGLDKLGNALFHVAPRQLLRICGHTLCGSLEQFRRAPVSRHTAAIFPTISAISGRRTISVTPMPRRIRGMKKSLSRSPIVGKHLPSPFPRRKRKKRRTSRRRRNRRKKRKPTMGRSRWVTSPPLGRQPDVRL